MKKQYIIPFVEVMAVSTVLMQKTGEASVLPGPGGAPAPREPFWRNTIVCSKEERETLHETMQGLSCASAE